MTRYKPFYLPTSKWLIRFAWAVVLTMFTCAAVGGVVSVDYIVTHLGDL